MKLSEYGRALAAWANIEKDCTTESLRRIVLFANHTLYACLPDSALYKWNGEAWETQPLTEAPPVKMKEQSLFTISWGDQ